MKKYIQKIGIVALLLMTFGAQARYLFTQLPGLYGRFYYPLEYHEDNKLEWGCFNYKVAAIGYNRDAFNAYPNCDTTCKVPWSHLIFNETTFALPQIFPNNGEGIVFGPYALAAASLVSPKYSYDEKGAIFNLEIESGFEHCDVEYRVGMRAFLPVRDIQISDPCQESNLNGVTLADVFQIRTEEIGSTDNNDPNRSQTNIDMYAIRLDFLSELSLFVQPGVRAPLLTYHNSNGEIRIGLSGGVNIGDATNDASGQPGVAVIATPDGVVPVNQRWGDRVDPTTNPDGTPTVGVTGTVAADGSGVAVGQRAVFTNSVDYTSLSSNIAAQRRLFVVPILQGGTGPTSNTISTAAQNVLNQINSALGGETFGTLQDFLAVNNIRFCEGRSKGLGDLDVNFYINRNWGCNRQFWGELLAGIRFPTADRLCSCLDVVKQPLGNNKHFEIRGGLSGGWDAYEHVKFMADATFVKVLKHDEVVAAPFRGATIPNIGPCINAKIDWWYFVGHVDASFFASDCCGFDLGYELYYQGRYNVCLCKTQATDFLGNKNQPLDPTLLEKDTKRIANKVRTAFFTRFNACTITAGWTQVFAGKNIGNETDWYLQFEVRF